MVGISNGKSQQQRVGKYKIQNRWSGLYLGIMNNSTDDGAWVVQMSGQSDSSNWFLLLSD